MGPIEDALRRSAEGQDTRQPPVSTRARVKFLTDRLKTTRAVAALLGVSQRSVERYLDGSRTHPPRAVAEAIDQEVKARWQPLVRKRAADRAAAGGIVIETRARFGYDAPAGSTDDPRERRLTVQLPGSYAARLFDALASGAGESALQAVVAEGLQEHYFKDGGRRAAGLLVRFDGIDYLDTIY